MFTLCGQDAFFSITLDPILFLFGTMWQNWTVGQTFRCYKRLYLLSPTWILIPFTHMLRCYSCDDRRTRALSGEGSDSSGLARIKMSLTTMDTSLFFPPTATFWVAVGELEELIFSDAMCNASWIKFMAAPNPCLSPQVIHWPTIIQHRFML